MGVLFGEHAPVIYAFGEVRELGRRDLRGPRVARSDMCTVVRRAADHTVAHLLILCITMHYLISNVYNFVKISIVILKFQNTL